MWERSTHAKKLNATLNETCRMISVRCLKPTNGIAPSDTMRAVASRTERTRQTTDERHPLNGHLGVVPRLKSQKSFIKCTEPNLTAKAARIWSYGENDSSPWTPVCTLTSVLTNTFQLAQRIPEGTQPGEYIGWPVKSEHVKVGIFQRTRNVCGLWHQPEHATSTGLMNTACSTQYLTTANGIAIDCARHWEDTI